MEKSKRDADSDGEQQRPFLSRNGLIAVLVSGLLLLSSYTVFHEEEFLHLLTREIGFALVVAVTIWVTFDSFLHWESEDKWTRRIEHISKNVFFGVFRKNFPEEFIREANVLLLDHTFMRRALHITYTITEDSYCDGVGGPERWFVKLNAVVGCKVRNVGNSVAKLPIGIGLPNPMVDEMKPHCRVIKVARKLDGKEVAFDLTEGETKFRASLQDDSLSHIPFELPAIDLAPGAEIDLIFNYVMAKEEEDTEIFQSLFPCESVTITVVDAGPTKRVVRARSIHPSDLENFTSSDQPGGAKTYNFKLDRYLLPHQGYAIWWKKLPARNAPGGG